MTERPSDRSIAGIGRDGVTVFLGALVVFGLIWRVDFFITDNWTIANTMVAVTDGHLYFERLPYGSATSPGTHIVDDRLYGRNYGHVVLSVPFAWALVAVARVVDLSVVLSVVWSLLFAVFAVTLGELIGHKREAAVVGGSAALGLFVLNLTFVEPLESKAIPLVALQISTMLAAALTAVAGYELTSRMYGRRIGLFAGVVTIVATPVAFWATIPKRHSLTALLPLLAVYCFYRSHSAAGEPAATRFRALAYIPVGLTAWIHAPEALVLFVALGSVDLLTARSNNPRQLLFIGFAFALSLLPMLVTNAAISGNPFEPPRALPPFTGAETTVPGEDGLIQTGGSSTGPGTASEPGGLTPGFAILATIVEKGVVFIQYMSGSVGAITDLERLYHVFVRGRPGLGVHAFGSKPLNLSMLESMPLLGPLLATPAVLYVWASNRDRPIELSGVRVALTRKPAQSTDLLVLVYSILLVLMYLPRLPLHITVTVRYLHPLYPLGVYFIIRLPFVRHAVRERWRTLTVTYGVAVLFGTPLFLFVASILANNPTEALQLNAGLALAGAALLGYWGIVSTLTETRYDQAGALTLAFAGATTTIFVLLAPFVYFMISTNFALPIARLIAESLTLW